jgi:tRNA(Ile)-lysidine synthase
VDAVLLDLVENTISRYNMILRGTALGVAVSGGADSVFLLHALRSLAARLEIRLHVLHLDHALRGPESDADFRFVHDLTAAFHLPLHSALMEPVPPGENLEQFCRRARHRFFASVIKAGHVSRVATGHTASDQAETVLMRLLRGAAPTGLLGVLPVTAEGLVRPLLFLRRDSIRSALAAANLPWRDDSSNAASRFLRNRVRTILLPALRAEQPRVDDSLNRLASAAARDHHFWSELVDQTLSRLSTPSPAGLELDATALVAIHPALQYRVLHAAASKAKSSPSRIEQSHLDALSGLLHQPKGAGAVHLPGLSATRSMDRILLHTRPLPPPGVPPVPLGVPGETRFGPLSIDARLGQGSASSLMPDPLDPQQITPLFPSRQAYTGEEWNALDWERIRGSLSLRTFRPGDHFHPVGSASGQPLKNMFQKARIPLWERRFWPIISDDDRIVWIAGFGPAAPLVARPGTQSRLLLRCRLAESAPDGSGINLRLP